MESTRTHSDTVKEMLQAAFNGTVTEPVVIDEVLHGTTEVLTVQRQHSVDRAIGYVLVNPMVVE